jgi:hypothetical protein
MFNFYAYNKKRAEQETNQQEVQKVSQLKDRMKSHRDRLYENYTKRISEFILHMEKQPIRINTYASPLENVGRVTDPAKFKGKPHIVVREYKTHRERLRDGLKYASIHVPDPQYQKPLNPILKHSVSAKDKPKRMYFKPKSNLERVVDELKTRNADIFELEGNSKKKNQGIKKFSPRKTWIALPNYAEHKEIEKDSESEHSEEIAPKQIFAGLHNKTYFKGVTSLLITADSKYRLKGNMDTCAQEILMSCNVKPKVCDRFLKSGEGKLVSNPEESVKETYMMLKSSINHY